MARVGNELYGGNNSPWASAVSNLGMALFGNPAEVDRRAAAKSALDMQQLQQQNLKLELEAKQLEVERRKSRQNYWSNSGLFGQQPAATPTSTPAAPTTPAAPADPIADQAATLALQQQDQGQVAAPEPAPARIDTAPLAAPGRFETRLANVESGGKADAQSDTSSASGQFQITDPTWKQYGGSTPRAIDASPEEQATVHHKVVADYARQMRDALGREPTDTEVYLAYRFGPGGAKAILAAPSGTSIDQALAQGVSPEYAAKVMRANPDLSQNGSPVETDIVIGRHRQQFGDANTWRDDTGGAAGDQTDLARVFDDTEATQVGAQGLPATVQGAPAAPTPEDTLPAAGSSAAPADGLGDALAAADLAAPATAPDVGNAATAAATVSADHPAFSANASPDDLLSVLDDYDKAIIKIAYDQGGPDAADAALVKALQEKQQLATKHGEAATKSAENKAANEAAIEAGKSETERYGATIRDAVTNGTTDSIEYALAYNRLYQQPHFQMVTEQTPDGREVQSEKLIPPVIPQGIPPPTYKGVVPAVPDAAAATGAGASTAAAATSPAQPSQQGVQSVPLSTGKEPNLTETQSKDIGWIGRMESADKNLNAAQGKGANLGSFKNFLLTQGGALPTAMLRSDADKAAYQAAEQFVMAINRHDSGAQITPEEWDQAYRVFLPAFNDPPTVVEQKARERANAVNGMYVALPPIGRSKVDELRKMNTTTAPAAAQTLAKVPGPQAYQHKAKMKDGRDIFSDDGKSWFYDDGQQVQ